MPDSPRHSGKHRPRGVVAAGHPATAEAAREVLLEGGNAFDAAVAALCTACVAEPALASLGGGGFLTARRADGEVSVFDFFTQTPHRRADGELDFYPAIGHFGGATQEFHLGMASIACPGVIKGLFAIQRELATMPMARLVEPAAALAEEGVEVTASQAHILQVIAPILLATPASRQIFAGSPDSHQPMVEGDRYALPEVADFLRQLAREGADFFYRGEPAAEIARACGEGGGHLSREDLESYRVKRHKPLTGRFRGATFATNPPPSVGGALIAFGLELLDGCGPIGAFGSASHLRLLVDALVLTQSARSDASIDRQPNHRACEQLLSRDYLHAYRETLRRHAPSCRGTTQISIADGVGNVAALTISNGEGSGYVVPGTGILLNNMLGEEDLSRGGFHTWPRDRRLASIMAPTIARRRDGTFVALGSGGSNRIRSAILQTLVNVLALDLDLRDAVERPRLHVEGDQLDLEPGFPPAAVAALRDDLKVRTWEHRSMFFGGVHAVAGPRGAGDPRRGGVAVVV
jgi:gamma-glutamyltranspeptidase/glutathione hydrolase